jgi:2,3-bisphosphoglycerate-independent phosphoglycerate mutase
MHILLIFLDGIGLGDDDSTINPFVAAKTPTLDLLANGHRWLRATGRQETERAVFLPTDANLGVPGRPQSGTGQAAILTGLNVAQMIGEHYGPKPNAETRELLERDNLFKRVLARGLTAQLINAYPPGLLASIARGKTLRSSIQHAVYGAGLPMQEVETLYSGEALSEDWTGEGWRSHLRYPDAPLYTPYMAGRKMVKVSRKYDFAFFSHWMTDTIGHRGTLEEAVELIETFDEVMRGALDIWDDDEGLMIITSDHGNFEHIGDRHHTLNPVPTVVIGSCRHEFAEGFTALTDIAPRIERLLFETEAVD